MLFQSSQPRKDLVLIGFFLHDFHFNKFFFQILSSLFKKKKRLGGDACFINIYFLITAVLYHKMSFCLEFNYTFKYSYQNILSIFVREPKISTKYSVYKMSYKKLRYDSSKILTRN